MEENTFKPGDVVQLKSGGQQMTVREVLDDNLVCVDWMTNTGSFRTKNLNINQLILFENAIPKVKFVSSITMEKWFKLYQAIEDFVDKRTKKGVKIRIGNVVGNRVELSFMNGTSGYPIMFDANDFIELMRTGKLFEKLEKSVPHDILMDN